jgi:hypothetical protein
MRMMLPAFILLWLGGIGLLGIFLNDRDLSTNRLSINMDKDGKHISAKSTNNKYDQGIASK